MQHRIKLIRAGLPQIEAVSSYTKEYA